MDHQREARHGERWLILILSLTYGVAIKVCLLNNSLLSFGITALIIVGLYLVLYIGTERRKKRG